MISASVTFQRHVFKLLKVVMKRVTVSSDKELVVLFSVKFH